jgi:hypothetical protein
MQERKVVFANSNGHSVPGNMGSIRKKAHKLGKECFVNKRGFPVF